MAERRGAILNVAVFVVSLGAATVGSWDQLHTIPETKSAILKGIPVCGTLDDPFYHRIVVDARRALDSAKTLDQLVKQPDLSRQIDCYKIAEASFASNNIDTGGGRWAGSLFLSAVGIVGLGMMGIEGIKYGWRALRGRRIIATERFN